MSDNVTTALQVNATSGNGEILILPEPRLVTFRITGKRQGVTVLRIGLRAPG